MKIEYKEKNNKIFTYSLFYYGRRRLVKKLSSEYVLVIVL